MSTTKVEVVKMTRAFQLESNISPSSSLGTASVSAFSETNDGTLSNPVTLT